MRAARFCIVNSGGSYDNGTKDFLFQKPDGTYGVKGLRRAPYNLSAVLEASTIYFVEGELCADRVNETWRVATTLDSGSKSKWLSEYDNYFKGKEVIILPDNDVAGLEYGTMIASHIPGSKIVLLPGLKSKVYFTSILGSLVYQGKWR